MSDVPVRVRAKRSEIAAAKRVSTADAEQFILAEIEATLERSGKRLEKLNADLDVMFARMDRDRPKT